jgi:predicted nuclease with TOPRIM domain
MSRRPLDSLHRVARQAGMNTLQLPEDIAEDLCKEFDRLRAMNNSLASENTELRSSVERANHRLNILEGLTP